LVRLAYMCLTFDIVKDSDYTRADVCVHDVVTVGKDKKQMCMTLTSGHEPISFAGNWIVTTDHPGVFRRKPDLPVREGKSTRPDNGPKSTDGRTVTS
jgi:hypothetical protein